LERVHRLLYSDEYLKPVMTVQPRSQVAVRDGTLNLTCQAVTSSHSLLNILWKKDHAVRTGLLPSFVMILSSYGNVSTKAASAYWPKSVSLCQFANKIVGTYTGCG